MSHNNINSNTWFEAYFEDRLAEMEPQLRNWANARYNTLDGAARDDMRALMTGIIQGYKVCEMREKHGWSSRRASKLSTLLRSVFYEALTGQPRDGNRATPAELKLLARLAAQMGRSPSWVHHLARLRQAQRESSDPLVQFATEELGAVLVEGIDWPRNRDGDDLAPVPVAV